MTKQRTIRDAVTIEGVGLQTGVRTRLTLKGAPADSGVSLVRVDLADRPLLNIRSMQPGDSSGAERRTTLGFGPLQIQTTEHLLAALAGLGIDNIVVELDNVELPGMDGSARDFADALRRGVIVEQPEPRKYIAPAAPVWCADRDSLLAIFPCDEFRVSYTLSYPGIGAQFFGAVIDDGTFMKDVAPARTFCSEAEAMELLKRGLGKGANYDNTLVMGAAGPIMNTLRYADEPVRHKVLDLIGDLYLAGAPVKGHVVAVKSGHRLNMELVRKLKEIS